MTLCRLLAGDPDPQQILDAEYHKRRDLDERKQRAVFGSELRHGFERHGDEVDDDQEYDEPADNPPRLVPDLLLEDLGDPALELGRIMMDTSQHDSLARLLAGSPPPQGVAGSPKRASFEHFAEKAPP